MLGFGTLTVFAQEAVSSTSSTPVDAWPLGILAIGIFTVIGMILWLRMNAFVALITAAIVVSALAPRESSEKVEPGKLSEEVEAGELSEEVEPEEMSEGVEPAETSKKDQKPGKIERVAVAFGESAGKIGIVIALAAIIGKCMMDSGAADCIVRAFLRLMGEKHASWALMGSGFVLSVPVFFDTVFYLLVPLARSLFRRTNHSYLMYILAIAAGGALTHTLVPPTPGPLAMAANLQVPIGVMILVGAMVALPSACVGVLAARVMNRMMPIPMRPLTTEAETEPLADSELPPLFVSLLPVVLPVLMISADTIAGTLAGDAATGFWVDAKEYTAEFGNANLALLVSAALALLMLYYQRGLTSFQLSRVMEESLMSGGLIILITAAGGAFGAMLKVAEVGNSVQGLFQTDNSQSAGLLYLFLGFGMASLLKVAQGSGTVSMITTSSMLAGMIPDMATLGYHPVYLATTIGAGSLVGSWMNDSGFWIFAKMGGLTELETLKTWTVLLAILGITSMVISVVLSQTVPMLS